MLCCTLHVTSLYACFTSFCTVIQKRITIEVVVVLVQVALFHGTVGSTISDNTIQIQALGRTMTLGMLYDRRSDKIIPGKYVKQFCKQLLPSFLVPALFGSRLHLLSEVCAFVWGIFVRGLRVETFVRVLRSSELSLNNCK